MKQVETTVTNQLPTTLVEFEQWEPNDGFKYEWNDGELIKFEKMKRKHLRLLDFLSRLFVKTKAFSEGANLFQAQDVMLTGIQLRRPDLAYFTAEQIENSDRENSDEPIPEFVIELISTHDQILAVKEKIGEYFKHGVKVVWLVYPDNQLVEVYTSFKEITVCTDNDICSAKPVVEDFAITVNDLFGKSGM